MAAIVSSSRSTARNASSAAAKGDPLPRGSSRAGRCCSIFGEVGIKAIDDHTIEIRLDEPDAVFARSAGLSRAVAREPEVPGNVRLAGLDVCREHRDQRPVSRCVPPDSRSHPAGKNEHYWDPDDVQLKVIDALAVQSQSTMYNLFATEKVDWITDAAGDVLRELMQVGRGQG